jgi:hypothetical protein
MNWYPGFVFATRPRSSVPGTTVGVGEGVGDKPRASLAVIRQPTETSASTISTERHKDTVANFFMSLLTVTKGG